MKSKKSEYSLANKGFIFSLDAAIALIIVILMISFTNYYLNRAEDATLSDLQLVKTGNDVFKLMDEERILQDMALNGETDKDAESIMSDLGFDTDIIIVNFEMKISTTCYKIINEAEIQPMTPINFETNPEPPGDRFIGSGTRYFFIPHRETLNPPDPKIDQDPKENLHCIGRYQIWLT